MIVNVVLHRRFDIYREISDIRSRGAADQDTRIVAYGWRIEARGDKSTVVVYVDYLAISEAYIRQWRGYNWTRIALVVIVEAVNQEQIQYCR